MVHPKRRVSSHHVTVTVDVRPTPPAPAPNEHPALVGRLTGTGGGGVRGSHDPSIEQTQRLESFPTDSPGSAHPSSSQQPGCAVDTTVLICLPGPPRDPRLSSGPDSVHICHPASLQRPDTKTQVGQSEARNQNSIHSNQRREPHC